jgi:hypothetical protein
MMQHVIFKGQILATLSILLCSAPCSALLLALLCSAQLVFGIIVTIRQEACLASKTAFPVFEVLYFKCW